MYVRFLIALLPPLSLLFVLACGGGSSTSTPSGTVGTATPLSQSHSPAPTTPGGSPGASSKLLVSPSRSIPPSADHVGLAAVSFFDFYNSTFGNTIPVPVDCPYDSQNAIIDCSSQGYGRIAVDPVPTGADGWLCRALLTKTSELVAASCTGTNGSAYFIYGLVS